MIQQCLRNALLRRGHPAAERIATIVTQVIVDRDDPAFENPSKPVGPFYSAEEAPAHALRGPAPGRGQRARLAPRRASPQPRAIVEIDAVRAMVDDGMLVIAAGGGRRPGRRGADGTLHGVEAVIDKDLGRGAARPQVGAARLLILTDVEQVALNYKKPDQRTWPISRRRGPPRSNKPAIRPNSVSIPVATTNAVAFPAATIVPM